LITPQQDGYPRTAQQARDLDSFLAKQGDSVNLVVHLDVPDEVLLERIEARWVHLPSGRVYNTTYNPPKMSGKDDVTGEPLIKRMDDKPEIFQKRLDQFHKENDPIKQFYEDSGALISLYGETR
jgi:adenylate kinase